jgi:DNA-binding MarR family transcriptional regulator
MSPSELTDADYARLLEFRTSLRRFLRWSEMQAEAVGLTPAQHQLLLAIRGHDDPSGPTVRDVAASLLVRHHSAVGLVDRAQEAGLVRRAPDRSDGRVVRLQLTGRGRRLLARVSAEHLVELRRIGELIPPDVGREDPAPSRRRRASSGPR